MHGGEDAVATLKNLSRRHASGEFVAATEDVEVHVHLYRGRVAWATSSASGSTLINYLLERCQIDRDALREAVQECRRTHKRFGETLVEWGIAEPAQVRDALAAQVRDALETLHRFGALQTLFLPRDSVYAEELTFELDEVLHEGGVEGASREELAAMGERMLRAIPEASWVQVLRGDETVISVGPSRGADARQFLGATSKALHRSKAVASTLRCDRGALVGRALETDDAWAWCGLRAGANLGLAKAVLSSLAPRRSIRAAPVLSNEWVGGPDHGDLPSFEVLEQAMTKSDELVSAVVLEPVGPHCRIVRREGFDASTLAGQICGLLGPMRSSLESFFAHGDDDLYVPHTSLHVEDACFTHFGTSLDGHDDRYLWLVLHRSGSPGFGWALLTTLARQLSEEIADRSVPSALDATAERDQPYERTH